MKEWDRKNTSTFEITMRWKHGNKNKISVGSHVSWNASIIIKNWLKLLVGFLIKVSLYNGAELMRLLGMSLEFHIKLENKWEGMNLFFHLKRMLYKFDFL